MIASSTVARPIRDRLLERTRPDGACLVWHGGTSGRPHAPYGVICYEGRQQLVHRVSYKLFVGPIPLGYQVDHLCFNTLCILPVHLEAVTPSVNRQRANAHRVPKTHCKRGHTLSGDNVWMGQGVRACRKCHALLQRRYYKNKLARRT